MIQRTWVSKVSPETYQQDWLFRERFLHRKLRRCLNAHTHVLSLSEDLRAESGIFRGTTHCWEQEWLQHNKLSPWATVWSFTNISKSTQHTSSSLHVLKIKELTLNAVKWVYLQEVRVIVSLPSHAVAPQLGVVSSLVTYVTFQKNISNLLIPPSHFLVYPKPV